MLRFFTRKKPDPAIGRLYDTVVAQARQPVFYQTFGVPDTLDGRFDMVVFHVWPLIEALKGGGKGGLLPAGQALFDTFVRDMEQNLRTVGASDTGFARKMKTIGKAFYGRYGAYCAAADAAALAQVAARNLLEDEARATSAEARALGAYAAAMRAAAAAATDLPQSFAFPDPAPFAREIPTEVTS
ncbi:MAG: hypothetical protein AcusKO_17140 [Acuticoccus sp.]